MTENTRNITVFGNYNENVAGDYYQNSEVILKRDFVARSPYKGLKRFNAKDKDLFFGREKLIQKLITAIRQSNLVLVLGASGSGKSSVVRAGVIPQIENLSATAYQACLFTPNRDPFVSLHRSLLDPEEDLFKESEVDFVIEGQSDSFARTVELLKSKDSQWLIFVDQFEELFTICSDLETRRNFIQGIVDLAQDKDQSVKLVLAMRSDFLEELGAYPRFAELAEKNINLVADMQTEELRQAIAQPAAHHGVVFEPDLVEEIIRDVQGQAASLPLLQYTLDLLWQESKLVNTERTLKSETYRQLGGVSGALQKHVNKIYQELSPEQQLATKQILLRLVDVVALEKSEVLRTAVSRRAYKSEFSETQAETVQLLVDQNLLVSDELKQEGQATVEIAHEALLSSWADLKDWISDAKSTIALNNRLAEDAAAWEDRSRANEELWTGSKLEKAIELRNDGTFDIVLGGLSDHINNFIDASVEWREKKIQKELAHARKLAEESEARRIAEVKAREEAENAQKAAEIARIEAENARKFQEEATIKAEEKATLEANTNKKLRQRAWGLGITSLVAFVFGLSALYLTDQFQKIAQKAQLEKRAANIKLKLSVDNKIELLLDSIELVGDNKKSSTPLTELLPEIQSVLYQTVQDSREISTFDAHQFGVESLDFSSDGKYIVSGSNHGIFSDSDDNTIKLWSVENQSLVHNFNTHQDSVNSVNFSIDGKYIVSGSDDNKIKLWSVENQSLVYTLEGHKNSVNSVNFSADGKYIVSGSDDDTIKLWSVENQSLVYTLEGHKNSVNSVNFSADGKYIVSGSDDGTIKLWSVENQSLVYTLEGHKNSVNSVNFSPNGRYIISGSNDSTVKLWLVKNQSLLLSFNDHKSFVFSVDFSPDGNYIASSSYDSTVKLWDLENQSLIHTFYGHQDSVNSVKFSPDGKYIASGSNYIGILRSSDHQTMKLWSVENQSLVHNFYAHYNWVSSVDFSPDGKYIVSGSHDGMVKLWDMHKKSLLHNFYEHQDRVRSVGFSRDSKYIVSGSDDNKVKLWDVNKKSLLHTFISDSNNKKIKSRSGYVIVHQDSVNSVELSPDGKYIVSGSYDKTIELWDVNKKSLVYTFDTHQAGVNSVDFSRDGKYIISGSEDNTIKL